MCHANCDVVLNFQRAPRNTLFHCRPGDTADTIDVGGVLYYRILGRTSVDIIKCGGFKLSALRIENVLLEHPSIREVLVLGLPDDLYGEIVAVVCSLVEGEQLSLAQLISWGTERLTLHELPRDLVVLEKIERNAMGKVDKRALRHLFSDGSVVEPDGLAKS
jgi:malonyl-CoA/methylmalonyl-CoA synthetase